MENISNPKSRHSLDSSKAYVWVCQDFWRPSFWEAKTNSLSKFNFAVWLDQVCNNDYIYYYLPIGDKMFIWLNRDPLVKGFRMNGQTISRIRWYGFSFAFYLDSEFSFANLTITYNKRITQHKVSVDLFFW